MRRLRGARWRRGLRGILGSLGGCIPCLRDVRRRRWRTKREEASPLTCTAWLESRTDIADTKQRQTSLLGQAVRITTVPFLPVQAETVAKPGRSASSRDGRVHGIQEGTAIGNAELEEGQEGTREYVPFCLKWRAEGRRSVVHCVVYPPLLVQSKGRV